MSPALIREPLVAAVLRNLLGALLDLRAHRCHAAVHTLTVENAAPESGNAPDAQAPEHVGAPPPGGTQATSRPVQAADRKWNARAPQGIVRSSGVTLRGTHAGDRRRRLSRPPQQQEVRLPDRIRRRRPANPALVFVAGFAGFIAAGTLLLLLPISSAEGGWTSLTTALFTATSAVCVTGLVVVDTGTYWSGFGQWVILLLIKVGGFGFMTSSTLLLLLIGREATLRERLLLKEALGTGGLDSVRHLARRIIVFTLIAEAAGAVVLGLWFLRYTDPAMAAWWGLFHAISAFNNAGFDVMGGFRSITLFALDPVVVLSVAALLVLGGISYTVVEDVLQCRSFRRLTLDSKLVLATTAALVAVGVAGILFTEWRNPQTLGGLALGPRLLNGFFHAVTPRTAGFNTIDTSQMTDAGLLLTMGLMFIGGASGSTAGGVKVQTFSLLFFAILSTVLGLTDVEAFRRRVPIATVLRALAVALISVAVVFAVALALSVTEVAHEAPIIGLLFEAFSAFATVGLSTGVTPTASEWGRLVLIATMFVGRVGPLTLVFALAQRERRTAYRWSEEGVRIG